MTDPTTPELVEIPRPHLKPGDPSVRLNYVASSPRGGGGRGRHFRFSFCEACARAQVAGFLTEIERTFPGRVVGS